MKPLNIHVGSAAIGAGLALVLFLPKARAVTRVHMNRFGGFVQILVEEDKERGTRQWKTIGSMFSPPRGYPDILTASPSATSTR
jgi:hypothetical protein